MKKSPTSSGDKTIDTYLHLLEQIAKRNTGKIMMSDKAWGIVSLLCLLIGLLAGVVLGMMSGI